MISRIIDFLKDESIDPSERRRVVTMFVLAGVFAIATVVLLVLGYFFPAFITYAVASILTFHAQYRMTSFIMNRADDRAREVEALSKSQNQFFSSMSHEIRTPINTIIGLNEMTMREDISDEVAENSRNIQSASKMLLHLINDILDKSKLESGKMELTPVPYATGDMFSEIVGMIWIRTREKKLDFHINIDPMLPAQLYGDEVRIKQILINLLTNAVKYTSEGSITLNVQYEKKSDRQVLVTYSVSDTGMGIKKESIPYLFNAFKRVDESENRYIEGTGLGLSIVKEFVDMMGGTITVNSVYTRGSTFVVSIPQEIEDEQGVGDLNLEARHSHSVRRHYRVSFKAPGARILVVDDNSANLLVVSKLLRDTEIAIDTADSGEEALEKTLEVGYDLILMDHLMPGMDGIRCMHEIRHQTGGLCKDTRIIVLTANAGSEEQALYVREGFDGYLVKPVSGEILEAEVSKKLPSHLVQITSDEGIAAEISEGVDVVKRKLRAPVMITTETVSDLPRSFIRTTDVALIPYHVKTADGDFLDSVEAESRGLLSYMEDGRCDARSVEPSVSEYELFFAESLTRANRIIHIAMSSRVGRGYANALEASRSFENVTVIDSMHLSSGMGLLVMEAHRMKTEGMQPDDMIKNIKALRSHINTGFIVSDTNYLAQAGRLNGTVNNIAQALLFRPVLALKKGKMGVGRIYFGSRDAAATRYIRDTLRITAGIDKRRLFITYAGLSIDELRNIRAEIEKHASFEEIYFQKASSAVTANCGPGTFGLLFIK